MSTKEGKTPDQILTGPQGSCDQPPHMGVIRLGEGFRGRQDSPTRFLCATGLHGSTTDSSDEVVTASAAPVSPVVGSAKLLLVTPRWLNAVAAG